MYHACCIQGFTHNPPHEIPNDQDCKPAHEGGCVDRIHCTGIKDHKIPRKGNLKGHQPDCKENQSRSTTKPYPLYDTGSNQVVKREKTDQ